MLVGGTGIMNVMYMTVQARAKEIGVRKAVGATTGQILVQFLQESALLALAGGVVGCALGAGMAWLSCTWAELPVELPLYSFVLALAFSLLIGIGFGVSPARKAASVMPVHAFRENL